MTRGMAIGGEPVVPAEFTGYFAAAAAAAGVLIGLLFVAVSLRPESVFGEKAPAAPQVQAGSAFTSLVNSFFVSLVALIPQAHLGEVAVIMALVSLWATARLHGQAGRQELHLVLLLLSVATYVYQAAVGVILVINPNDSNQVLTVAYLLIASFAVALTRAWALMQGRSTRHVGAK
jgi:hypothetical protein